MTTFNGEKYIVAQLNSILPQLDRDDEIIICDDGSTDKTLNIIDSLNDSRIKVFHNSFRNVILNFESALEKAEGDHIFLSDQDDIWYDNKVAELCQVLESYDLVYTNATVFKEDLKSGVLFNNKDHYHYLNNFIKNHCLGATMAFNAKVLEYSLPFPRKIPMHDMWIYFISALYVKAYYYKKPLIYYRRHGANVSNASDKTTNSLAKIIGIRITLLVLISKRVILISLRRLNHFLGV